jgi:hypothetical protein
MGLSLDSAEIEEQVRLVDYEGELFRNDAVEYMKYDTAADTIKVLLGSFPCWKTEEGQCDI